MNYDGWAKHALHKRKSWAKESEKQKEILLLKSVK